MTLLSPAAIFTIQLENPSTLGHLQSPPHDVFHTFVLVAQSQILISACNVFQVAQLHAAALAEDASVFAYDEVYDSLKESEKPKRQAQKERKSRYIEGLLDKAKERNREQDIIYERQCVPSSILTFSYSICRSD